MEAVIEKECSALGGLFQTIISDMKVRGRRLRGGPGGRKPSPPHLAPPNFAPGGAAASRGAARPPTPGPWAAAAGGSLPQKPGAGPPAVEAAWRKGPHVHASPPVVWGLRVCFQDIASPSFPLLCLSCSNTQAVILHQGQRFPNLSLFLILFFYLLFWAVRSLAE